MIAASAYGTTVRRRRPAARWSAAAAASDLAAVTDLVERCLLADLGAALSAVLGALDDRLRRWTPTWPT